MAAERNVQTDVAPFRAPTTAPFVTAGELLGTLRDSCHAAFFDWITREVSDNDDNYRHQFNILLGSYVSTITLTRFLETGLSVSCICVRFPELRYADAGVVQFVVSDPIMATGDAEVPARPVHFYITKRWNRANLTSSLSICATAVGLISGETLDGTAIADFSRVRALNQLARNMKTALDSFERGTINHVIHVLLAKSPPSPLLRPMVDAMKTNRDLTAVARGALLAIMKRAICQDFFFVDKERRHGGGRGELAARLNELIRCTMPSVADARISHRTLDGRPVEGVLLTTSTVKELLMSLLPSAGAEAIVPAAYSEMVITGQNLVSALITGQAVRNYDEAASRLLAFERGNVTLGDVPEPPPEGDDGVSAEMRVAASLIDVGGNVVFLDALEKVYARTRVEYPLVGSVDLTFGFPIGIFKPAIDRYANSAADLTQVPNTFDARTYPPRAIWFFNKDGAMLTLSFEDALTTLTHPIVHGIADAVEELANAPWVSTRTPAPLGFSVQRMRTNLLRVQMSRFLEALLEAPHPPFPDATLINSRTTEQFLHHTNPFLPLELHPFYDVFRVTQDLRIPHDSPLFPETDPITLDASPRLINGNLPLPLCSADFRTHRGRQLSHGYHRLSIASVTALEITFNDSNYPLALYMIEAAIHGSEAIFMESQRLVARCVNSYWQSTRGIAFATSFPMVFFIYHNMAGMINRECHAIYADIVEQLRALRAVISRHTLPAERLMDHGPEELNHLLADPAVFPPMLYDCDPLLRARGLGAQRRVRVTTFGDNEPNVILRDPPGAPEFNTASTNLYHGQQYTVNARVENGEHHDAEWTLMSKIFYFSLLPAISRGRCCSMGVEYEMLYALLNTTRLPTTPEDMAAGINPGNANHPLHPDNLLPEVFNTLLSNGQLTQVDNESLAAFLTAAMRRQVHGTTPLRVRYTPDPAFQTLDAPDASVIDGVLYNGIIMMNYASYDATIIVGNYFYAVPVNGFYANRSIVETSYRATVNISTLAPEIPLVPTIFGGETYRSVRTPCCLYAERAGREVSISDLAYALMASYFKLSAVSLIHQLRKGLHPGFALTALRQDRVLADQMMFARRASESYYFGAPTMTHRSENGGLAIDVSQPRAHIDMGLGFSGSRIPAALNTVVTDMGARCQNLHNARFPGQFTHAEINDFVIAQMVENDSTALGRAQPPLVLPYDRPPLPSGVAAGQLSTVEFIVTPVSTDLRYFLNPFDPRGRCSSTVHTGPAREDDDPRASAEATMRVLYDHATPDPAFSSRATVNPWASQRHSLADRMYNAERGFVVSSDYYSPCAKFFTPSQLIERDRCLSRMLRDAATAFGTTTGDTEYQFVAPPGSEDLVTDPCSMTHEAYPLLCASDPALFGTYSAQNVGRRGIVRENHYAQYMIYDRSPLAGILPGGFCSFGHSECENK